MFERDDYFCSKTISGDSFERDDYFCSKTISGDSFERDDNFCSKQLQEILLAALITPVLGDIRPECRNASLEYIDALNQAKIWALMSECYIYL
jgi:hypothetical protein